MSFEDDLLASIKKGLEERDQIELNSREFNRQWEDLRTELLPLFKKSAEVIKGELGTGRGDRDNGGMVLEIKRPDKDTTYALRFSPDRATQRIVCSSSIPDLDEPFELDNLTANIEMKINKFAQAVAKLVGPNKKNTAVWGRR